MTIETAKRGKNIAEIPFFVSNLQTGDKTKTTGGKT